MQLSYIHTYSTKLPPTFDLSSLLTRREEEKNTDGDDDGSSPLLSLLAGTTEEGKVVLPEVSSLEDEEIQRGIVCADGLFSSIYTGVVGGV